MRILGRCKRRFCEGVVVQEHCDDGTLRNLCLSCGREYKTNMALYITDKRRDALLLLSERKRRVAIGQGY